MNLPNFVFFGTPQFAATILKLLIENSVKPSLVITNPDKPAGRKKIITPPPVKEIAIQNNIKVWQPEKLNANNFINVFQKETFGILAAYGKIVPKEVIQLFPMGIIGVHPSLLPKYRGPSPIQSVILNGDLKTGTTLFILDEKVDHGPILSQETLEIDENINFSDLQNKLAELSAFLIIKTLPLFLENKLIPSPQDESLATYTRKFDSNDAFVKPQDLEEAMKFPSEKSFLILRKIRALNPEPGVWTIIDECRVKLLEAKIENNRLKLVKIQKSGKKPVTLK